MPLQKSFRFERIEQTLHDAARQGRGARQFAHCDALAAIGDGLQDMKPASERLARAFAGAVLAASGVDAWPDYRFLLPLIGTLSWTRRLSIL